MNENDKLKIWTIFDDPEDYPGEIVARCFAAESSGEITTSALIRGKSLEQLREHFAQLGLARLSRFADDTNSTVETWF